MKPRILIAEDDVIIGDVLRRIIERHDYEVIAVVRNGRDVVNKTLSTEPDLVLLDVHMQSIGDGIEAARRIFETRRFPIVFLSGDTDDAVRERIQALPGTVLLGKPVVAEDLIEIIRGMLG